MKRLLLLIFLSAVAVAHADPTPGVLVWTETTSDSTATGISDNASCFFDGIGCAFDSFADRTFSVTTAGEFMLTLSVYVGFSSSNCSLNPFIGCQQTAFVAGDTRDDASVSGIGSVFVSQSFSASSDCGVGGFCTAFANGGGSNSDIFNLGVGDYTLHMDYFSAASGADDPDGNGSFTSTVVPYPTIMPEPKGVIVALAGAFLAVLILKAKLQNAARAKVV